MKKLVLVCGILASVVSVSMGAMSQEEWQRASHNCFENEDKSACQALINHSIEMGWGSLEQCSKDNCALIGHCYYVAGRYREAILYYEKAIALGDNSGYGTLGDTYAKLQDYYNAKKYYEIACNKGNGDIHQSGSCFNLGNNLYYKGQGVRQDYAKAAELWKKACDMKNGDACNGLGVLYAKGQGVRQNLSTAKQYYGKACDLGNQVGCDNYKLLHNQGVQ
ncbi:tetratricopeptide repeat protein [Helicobacter macacae]|uniref:beta-lactamase n=1 Tax=Helicobacter macacae MIT 99-5501 TaxID=1357400 RepID=V8CA07_9HELI|nr:tetratricopeptide repeat protein [Helicobacter macacae]ETD24248.1 hypothetical protein HMPREF2086_00998 [Helicobacter macacae MIT 99-5501]